AVTRNWWPIGCRENRHNDGATRPSSRPLRLRAITRGGPLMARNIRTRSLISAMAAVLAMSGLAASASAGTTTGAPAPALRTNLKLLAGVDFDFPFFTGTRALSASPVFMVEGDALRLDVRRTQGTIRLTQDGVALPVRPRSILEGLPGFLRWRLVRADGSVAAS